MKRYLFTVVAIIPLLVSAQDINNVCTPEPVDLGLSVKWACCNLGASHPEERGNFFRWGDTTAYSQYSEELEQVSKPYSIGDFSGNARFDAASAILGNGWRTPTYAEYRELMDMCEWESTTRTLENGDIVQGFIVTGPNHNYIFLPVTHIIPMGQKMGVYMSSTVASSWQEYSLFFFPKKKKVQIFAHPVNKKTYDLFPITAVRPVKNQ